MQLRTILRIDADLTSMPFGEYAPHHAMWQLERLIEKIVEDYFTGYPSSVTVLANAYDNTEEAKLLLSEPRAYSAPEELTLHSAPEDREDHDGP